MCALGALTVDSNSLTLVESPTVHLERACSGLWCRPAIEILDDPSQPAIARVARCVERDDRE